jgi:hypothetical protein
MNDKVDPQGLLRLHSRYGPPDRSATQGDLCREAPARTVTQPSRSPATGPIDNYPGEILLTDGSRLRGALPRPDLADHGFTFVREPAHAAIKLARLRGACSRKRRLCPKMKA